MEGPKEVIVVDASIIAKWFVEEEYSENALRLREDYRSRKIDVWSTQLMPFEVLNALRYNRAFSIGDLKKAAKALNNYRIALHPILNELTELCITNAMKYGITIYDSSYVSLSVLLNKQFYTADRRLTEKAREIDLVHHIVQYSK